MFLKFVKLLFEIFFEMDWISDVVVVYWCLFLCFFWCLDFYDLVYIMKSFVILFLYGGVEVFCVSLGVYVEGVFILKDNIEEGVLFLMIFFCIMNKE